MEAVSELLGESRAAFACLAGLLGLLVGSFLNVVIHRLPRMMEREWLADCAACTGSGATAGEPPPAATYNLVTPRSACPACGSAIRARDNVPVVSWLLLRGRCASCSAPISARYPLVELATGVLSALVALRFGYGLEAGLALGITWTLIAMTGIDMDEQLLPDSLTLPLLWAGLLCAVLYGHGYAAFPVDPRSAILGAASGYLSLWSICQGYRLLTGKDGMGHGDFKLYAALGAWLGWQALLPLILYSAAAGTVIGVGLIVLRRHDREVPIPFGPFLAIAGWLVLMYPATLIPAWLRFAG